MPLTPEQFDKLVTKDDLKNLEERMDKKFDAVDKKFDAAFNVFASKDDLEEKLKNVATKEDINKVLTAVDGIAHKHQKFEVELISNQVAHDHFGSRIKQLEKQRIN